MAAAEQTEARRQQARLEFALMEDGYLNDPKGQWASTARFSSVYGYRADSPAALSLLRGPPDNESRESGHADVGLDPRRVSLDAIQLLGN